jgi:hypothetical protein
MIEGITHKKHTLYSLFVIIVVILIIVVTSRRAKNDRGVFASSALVGSVV